MPIFALATSPGISGLAVVRLSGTGSLNIAKKITKKNKLRPRIANFTNFYDLSNCLIDKGIYIFFPGPNSYTGDDVIEFHLHGSNAVINCFLKNLSKFKNCRLAKPGEFSQIALLNKKINLLQAEALIDLINSETEIQRVHALKMMSDDTTRLYENLRSEIIKILSDYEAVIDFSDDDVQDNIFIQNRSKLLKLKHKIDEIIKKGENTEKIRDGFTIAIVGPPNSGKSSLMNRLIQREASIVSKIPGTTRDVIEASIMLNGYLVKFLDTAGIRKAQNIIEKKGIELTNKLLKNSDLKIFIFDYSKPIPNNFLNLFDQRSIILLNKIDLSSKQKFKNLLKLNVIKISVKKNLGIEKLLKLISRKIISNFKIEKDSVISRLRHQKSLINASLLISNCLKKSKISEIDIAAEDLRLAARSLGEIVGSVNVEEVLDNIFRDFCIGK